MSGRTGAGRLKVWAGTVLNLAALLLLGIGGCTPPAPLSPVDPPYIVDPTPAITAPPASPPVQVDAPRIVDQTPASGATDVDPQVEIQLRVSDDDAGIDRTSISMTVNDRVVVPTIVGSPHEYIVSYVPPIAFAHGRIVQVTVTALNLGDPPRPMTISFAFRIKASPAFKAPGPDPTPVRMVIKSYGRHTPAYDARILAIRPRYVVDNPLHGLYGVMPGRQTTPLLQDVQLYRDAGIKVIGYLTVGYEGKSSGGNLSPQWYSLETNKGLIRDMAIIDGVDGVFFDECSAFPNASSRQYLKELADYARSFNLLVWGNVGLDNFDPWFFTGAGFDYVHSTEDWRGQALTPVQKEWAHRISVSGFKQTYTADDAYNLTLDAWRKGVAFAYINDVDYTSMAPWFEEYASRLHADPLNSFPAR